MKELKNAIFYTLYGAIVGDALGVPVEFLSRKEIAENPVTDMKGYGTYNLPEGSWSDDSSMTLCLADSIGKLKGIDYEDILKNFTSWVKYSKYTPDKQMFDIGHTCRISIMRYIEGYEPLDCGLTGELDNGNGSLMRISPLPFYLLKEYGLDAFDKEEAFEITHNISRLTHGHEISLLACDIYCAVMLEIIRGTQKKEVLPKALDKINKYVLNHDEFSYAASKYQRLFESNFSKLPEETINSSGYVVDTLEAALWCFLNSECYKDCVLKAVNLGEDTDTVACVAGSIAGLYYESIPEEWINSIRNRSLIDKVLNKFSGFVEK